MLNVWISDSCDSNQKLYKNLIFHKIEHGLTCIELSSKITFEPIHKVTGLVWGKCV